MRSDTTTTEGLRGPTPTHPAASPLTRRWEQFAAATGIVFVLLQVTIFAIVGDAPALDDPVREIRQYLVDDGNRILLTTTLGALSAFLFIWFLGSLRAVLRTAEGSEGRMSAVAFGGGLVTVTLTVMGSLPAAALAWNDTAASADRGLLRAFWNLNALTFVAIGATAGVFALAVAVVILRTRVLPTWVAWIGVVSAAMGVIEVFEFVADDPDTPVAIFGLGSFLLAMVFILLLSVFMVLRLGRTEPPTA